ncbi:MAG: hypothetical protein JWM71_1321, partial [Solirubrobacteraceae bacterium]|nr:hypothetical protein [Solirubrobacteraceae bacterium]
MVQGGEVALDERNLVHGVLGGPERQWGRWPATTVLPLDPVDDPSVVPVPPDDELSDPLVVELEEEPDPELDAVVASEPLLDGVPQPADEELSVPSVPVEDDVAVPEEPSPVDVPSVPIWPVVGSVVPVASPAVLSPVPVAGAAAGSGGAIAPPEPLTVGAAADGTLPKTVRVAAWRARVGAGARPRLAREAGKSLLAARAALSVLCSTRRAGVRVCEEGTVISPISMAPPVSAAAAQTTTATLVTPATAAAAPPPTAAVP